MDFSHLVYLNCVISKTDVKIHAVDTSSGSEIEKKMVLIVLLKQFCNYLISESDKRLLVIQRIICRIIVILV